MTEKKPRTELPFAADISVQPGDIVFATDKRGRVVFWNNEAETVSGQTSEEVRGRPYALACKMTPSGAGIDLAAVMSGHDYAGGVRCQGPTGGDVALYLFATAGRNKAGEPAGVVFVGRDVTGLWRVEDAARASTDKYRLLFENTLDSVAIADLDGRVLEANPACLRIYGYTAEDVKHMNLVDVVAPESRGAAAEVMAALAQGKLVQKSLKMVRKDGTGFVVELVALVVLVGGEKRILSITRDVTTRAAAEAELKESEQRYRAIFESVGDAVFLETVDGSILEVNENACRLLGYGREELLASNVSDLVPPESRVWLPRISDAILRDGTVRVEAVNLHKSGRQIPVELTVSAVGLEGKTLVLAIARDITERKQAEQALRESEEKFRSVSEQSPNMIFINRRGRVVYANRKCEEQMGYSREEFYAPGFDFLRLIAPDSVDQIKAVFARHARGEEVEPYEYALVTKDGRRMESIITTKLIDYEGSKAILGIVTDITERKATEQALRESEERFRGMVDASPDAIAVYRDGSIVMANPACVRLLGFDSPDALVGVRAGELVHPDDLHLVVEHERMLLAGASRRMEAPLRVRFRHRGGRLVHAEVVAVQTTWDGAPAVQVMARDMTEQRWLEQVAEETSDELYAVLNNSPEAIAAESEGVLVYANQRFARLYGYESPAEVVGRPAADFDAPQDRERLAEYSQLREHGQDAPAGYAFQGLRRDGTVVPMEATISTYRSRGKLHILGFIREAEPAPGDH